MTTANTSVGYNYQTIDSGEAYHIDSAITINTTVKSTIAYQVAMPDGSSLYQSTVHDNGDTVGINSTVRDSGTFTTDGYRYQASIAIQ